MIYKFVALLGLLCSCIYALELTDGKVVLNDKPGKLYMWSNLVNSGPALESHVTKSIDISQAGQLLSEQADKYEVIVVLTPDVKQAHENCMNKNSLMKDVYTTAKNQQTLHYVYPTQTETSLDSTVQQILATSAASVKNVNTIHDLQVILHDNNRLFFDGKQDIFHLPTSAIHAQDNHHREMLSTLASKPILFVTYDNVVAGKEKMTRQLGEYASIAKHGMTTQSDSQSTSDSKSKYYSPEGAEYSIYYADTYLYITPDIFTGLMTGIFMFFVALIGLTCLGNIQGNSTFIEKLPIVGKEA